MGIVCSVFMGVTLIASAGMAKGAVAKCIANGAPHIDAEGNIIEEAR